MSLGRALSIVLIAFFISRNAGAGCAEDVQALFASTSPHETVSFSDLTDVMKKNFHAQFLAKRISPDRDLKWNGPPLTRRLRATELDADDRLRATALKRVREDQGRDEFDEIFAVFTQTGLGQGQRKFMNGSNMLDLEAHLKKALSLVEGGQRAEARKELEAVKKIDALINQGVNPLSTESAPLVATRNAKQDWPLSGLPADEGQLIKYMKDLMLQGHQVTPAPELDGFLKQLLTAATEQGRRWTQEDYQNLSGWVHQAVNASSYLENERTFSGFGARYTKDAIKKSIDTIERARLDR